MVEKCDLLCTTLINILCIFANLQQKFVLVVLAAKINKNKVTNFKNKNLFTEYYIKTT